MNIYYVNSQETIKLSFEKSGDTIRRSQTDYIHPITLKLDSVKIDKDSMSLYTVAVKVLDDLSTLAKSYYSLSFNSITLDKMSNRYTFFLTLKKDSLADQDRLINFSIEVTKKSTKVGINISDINQMYGLVILGAKSINNYNYLAYVGTNFDLVDGIKTQNLFFATSLFSPPQFDEDKLGFSLTLYGNRTLTTTDTSGNVEYTSKVVGLGGDSARFFRERAFKTTNRVTDNLGANFSPLMRLGGLSNANTKTQLYYAPQFEFIWRRTRINTTYKNRLVVDSSLIRHDRPITGTIILNEPNQSINLNNYDVYLGFAGLLLRHENKFISIRIQGSMGINFSYITDGVRSNNSLLTSLYIKKYNIFAFVRAWITEPTSGITLGAEVSNNFVKKGEYQPYFNVTLSKAIKMDALGAILKPLTK